MFDDRGIVILDAITDFLRFPCASIIFLCSYSNINVMVGGGKLSVYGD